VFVAPLGHTNVPKPNGKSLIPDPERAPLVQETFRDFATGLQQAGTASWSKGRSARLSVAELERLQPTPGYMRLRKRSVLHIWHKRKVDVSNEVALAEQRAKRSSRSSIVSTNCSSTRTRSTSTRTSGSEIVFDRT
jgi:hypothetical protein